MRRLILTLKDNGRRRLLAVYKTSTHLLIVLFRGVMLAERSSVADAPAPLVLHPTAVEEAQAAWQWYLERSQSAADSFLAEIDHGIEAISEAPERWPLFVHGTRRYLFRRL